VTTGQFDYPILLNLNDRLAVVVGGGSVGVRKVEGLLRAGARVRLIDPVLAASPYPSGQVESIGRDFQPADLAGAMLVFACTDSGGVNRQIVEEAQRRHILCCCAGNAQSADFSLPALLTRENLQVTVSTGGGSPAVAAQIRDQLAEQIPDSWGFALDVMVAVRQKLLTEKIRNNYNQQVLRSFWTDRLLPLVEQRKLSEIDQLLVDTYGAEFTLEQLQVQLPDGIT
jgi:precorrin-2 dehydrogenase/sirohydrochlorin ferrochelatase